ncbi:MAG: hypothetical protein ACE5K7_08475, partial [Phycisphaerae bacterium]
MATDALPAKAPSESDWVDRPGHPASVGEVAKAVFQPLTSLKLTIALLSLGILLVLFGTLAQDKLDMWEVITHYFRSWITWVELRMLLPDAWFPHRPALIDQPLFGKAAYLGFPFPGGLTIGLLTAANLLAAHTLRFKVQSRGTRLWAGIGLLLLGGLFTWLVIASGHNQEGIQGEPAIGWQNLWWCVKLGLLAAWLGSIAWLVSVQRRPVKRPIDWAVPGATCAAVGILAISLLLLGQRAYLGNSGMRILWQLIQGGLAGVVLLGGCLLLFRKRGGIALIHAGIGLMMLNELLVGNYAVEERMRIQEGQSVNYVKDIRAVELAVVDPSDPQHDRVVVVPLSANGRQSRFLKQRRIRHPKLPFDLEIVKYYKNSSGFRDLQPGEKTPATAGIGATVTVDQKRPAS